MKYAIIAAGEGSRLAQEGITQPKPLVKVHGEHLIERLIRIFTDNDAEEIVVICNDKTKLVSEYLRHIEKNGLNGKKIPLRHIVKNTPSSMHSFYELSRFLNNSPFILTTVDTIFNENEFIRYTTVFQEATAKGWDGVMAVTDFIDDEKPLYVGTDEQLNITGFWDKKMPDCRYVSGGIYGLTPAVIRTLQASVEKGESRMRNFQRALITDSYRLKAHPMGKIFDIDHMDDILKADKFLNEQTPINTALSYGLGIMFLQLLSKKRVLPWALNSEQVGFEWQYVLHELQGQGRLSSLNYRIVNACLSPRQRENLQLSLLLDDEYVREPLQDNPKIQNWQDLERELKKSLVDLRKNLVSVANEAHRQLTVIDLD